ncbi:MAG: arsenic metallochaperone ArsD family protein [Armatimonadetes bacterium]|nr:arsenic metallochaperone ArsD family protein [Armatimonadota bacterium]
MSDATRLVEVHEPQQCCPGGACTQEGLDALVEVHEALQRFAREHAGRVVVRRLVFPRKLEQVRDPESRQRLTGWLEAGLLPVTCIDGMVAKTGAYPTYGELLDLTGLASARP